jgi:hypothetical protein
MPASELSIRLTDAYRTRIALLQKRAGEQASGRWATVNLDDLDRSHAEWLAGTVATLELFQRAGVSLTLAYVSAFIASELNRAPAPPPAPRATVGVTDDGRPLAEALITSLIAVKAALKDDKTPEQALAAGLVRAGRMTASAAIYAPRAELDEQLDAHPGIVGWRRVTFGGCGACLAAATGAIQQEREILRVHDHCRCTKEPVVADVAETTFRPTGRDIFGAMSAQAQDQLLGADKARLIRSGEVLFEALIAPVPQAIRPDGITEAPLEALAPQ